MKFWTSKKTVFICLFLIVFGIPAIVLAATWWSYNNETNLVATDEFLVGSNTRGGLVNVLWSDVLSEIAADGTFQTVLTNEAGLYSALSDVSQFYEPGDLLQTESSDSPTALDTNGQINFDNDDERVRLRLNGSTYQFDFTGDASDYILKSNGSGVFTLQADTNYPVILDLADDASNESTDIGEIATSGDTNSIFTEPSADKLLIDVSQNWPTADTATSATTATTATTANAGDSATAFFSAGTIEHEYGGLEADVSAYSGLVKIAGGTTSAVTSTAYSESILDDADEATFKATVNLEIGTDVQAYDADLSTYAGITPSANVQTMLGSADNSAILSNIGAEPALTDEASLYSALSDVSQFYEPGDLLQTESGDSPTALDTNGQLNMDNDDDQFLFRVGGNTYTFDMTGDSSGYVLKSNGSGTFTLAADVSGGGGTPNILDLGDDASNESTDLIEIATSGDTNSIFTEPSADKLLIDVSQNWPTADAATTATSATTATTATTANAGDSATAFFSAGTIEHEYGGLEADVSAYDGLIGISGGATSNVTDEAGLYSALSDVSQFYEPGDLLRTENGNTPTAPSNDGEFVVDTDDEQFIIRVGGGNKNFDFTGDSAGYVFGSDGSGNFTLQAAGAGDVTSVLGDTTGAIPVLFQAWTAFSAADDTPDVSTATNFRTVDTTTITDFDGSPVDGQFLYTYCGAATVFDLTSSGLSAWNRSTDLTCTVGQVVAWKYYDSTGDWNCENCPDETTTYPVLEERTITDPSDADDYYWFKADGVTAVSSVDCIAQGSTPSITVDVQECDSSGASCSSILSSVITCNGGNDAGTVTDTSLADNAWIYVALGAPSGTVSAISVTLAGTK